MIMYQKYNSNSFLHDIHYSLFQGCYYFTCQMLKLFLLYIIFEIFDTSHPNPNILKGVIYRQKLMHVLVFFIKSVKKTY